MLKKHMAACLVASAFITMPVLAQTSTSPGGTSPAATPPTAGATGGAGGGSGASAGGGAASGRFITQQQQTQWRASRLIGINVYGADNERIGDINEVLVDRQGNADAVVIGVGGFLGIGEKNVALPFNAFEWQMEDTRRTASAGGSGAGGSGSGAASSGGAARTGDTAGAGAGTGAGTAGTGGATGGSAARSDTAGTTASTSAAGGSGSGSGARSSGADRGYPDHAVLRMTKADLENAPTFRYVGDRSTDAGSGGGAGSGAGRTSGSGTGGSGAGTGAGSPGAAPQK